MKNEIAMICGCVFLILAVSLRIREHIGDGAFVGVLIVGTVVSFGIAGFDRLARVKGGGMEIELTEATREAKDTLQNLRSQEEDAKALRDELKRLGERLERESEELGFLVMISEAQAGNRDAYDRLRAISADESTEKGRRAAEVTAQIVDSNDFSAMYQAHFFEDSSDAQGAHLRNDELFALFNHEHRRIRKMAYDTLANRKCGEAIPSIIEHLRTEKNLGVCVAALHALCEITGEQTGPLDFQHWYSWWDAHKAEFDQ